MVRLTLTVRTGDEFIVDMVEAIGKTLMSHKDVEVKFSKRHLKEGENNGETNTSDNSTDTD